MASINHGHYTVNVDIPPRLIDEGFYWLCDVSDNDTGHFLAIGLITDTMTRPTAAQFVAEYERKMSEHKDAK